jgi:heme-degrading monooxygenase HmoA
VVIVRIWTTDVVPGREPEYVRFAQERSRAMFLVQPGCLGVLFLRTSDGRHAACSFWRSAADVASLARSPSYQATAAALGATGVLEGKARVVVYEVEGGGLDGVAVSAALSASGGESPA